MTTVQADLSSDLGRLLNYVANVAISIRMNSAYTDLTYKDRNTTDHDVMWLADSLHNLNVLGKAVQANNNTEIIEACDALLLDYQVYTDGAKNWKSDPKETFERYKHSFDLQEAMSIFADIRRKASTLGESPAAPIA
jgi:hypothetical protein